LEYGVLVVAASEGGPIQGRVGEEDESGSGQDVRRGAGVDGSAQRELLGGHETAGAEHAAHVVAVGPVVVAVQVHKATRPSKSRYGAVSAGSPAVLTKYRASAVWTPYEMLPESWVSAPKRAKMVPRCSR
jgi:hypothetical protein